MQDVTDLPAVAGATHPAEPQAKRTLFDLVARLANADDELADPNFDPAQLVEDLRGKVDAVNAVVVRMGAVAGFLKVLASPLTKKAAALLANKERLRAYVADVMVLNKFESLPGEAWKVHLMDSAPSLDQLRPCTAQDKLDHPDWVNVDRVYSWDTPKIKAALVAKQEVPPEIGASLSFGHWPDFRPNVPESLERKKKPRKKKGTVDAAVVVK